MKLRKRTLIKIAIGFLLISIAGLLSIAINDMLSAREPEYALPSLKVQFGEEGILPTKHVLWESYSWRFFITVKNGIVPDPDAVENIEPAWVPAGAPLDLLFSQPPSEIEVSMSKNNSSFIELGGELSAPMEQGIYTYRVIANWGMRGTVVYFFKIEVPGYNE